MGAVMTRFLGTTTSLALASLLLLAATTVPVPASGALPGASPDLTRRVQLTAPAGEVVRSATVRLDDVARSARVADRTVTMRTTPFKMVGFTWSGAEPHVEVQTLTEGRWTPWQHVPALTDGRPATGRGASSLLWFGRSTAVRVRTDGARALDVVLIDPGVLPGDDDATARPGSAARARQGEQASAPRPDLLSRRDWNANPLWRNGKPFYLHKLKQVHVHHTATGNSYSRADVPAILRGMYRYHTKTLGWFDIGYNFLVDRFGRAWVGRSGGVNRLVRGAHTLGFNHSSVGIAMIGNLEGREPWPDALTAVVKLASWKLDRHERYAIGPVTMTSSGSDKYREGERVRLPAIDGHRDTNNTACPGQRLYSQLSEIRRRAQWRIDHW